MDKIQIDMMIQTIRGYNFAYKATQEVCYKNTRDKLIFELRLNLGLLSNFKIKAA